MRVAVLVIALVLVATACGSPAPTGTSQPQPSSPEWDDPQWAALIAAAKQEGKIVIAAGGEPSRNYPPLLEVFSKRYGVTAEMTTGNATETVNRLLAERSSGSYTVDVGLIAHNTSQRRLVPAGALVPVEPLLIHPEVVDKAAWHGAKFRFADEEQQYVFLYTGRPENNWRFEISAHGYPSYALIVNSPGVAAAYATFGPGGRSVALPFPYLRSGVDPACWANPDTQASICAW